MPSMGNLRRRPRCYKSVCIGIQPRRRLGKICLITNAWCHRLSRVKNDGRGVLDRNRLVIKTNWLGSIIIEPLVNQSRVRVSCLVDSPKQVRNLSRTRGSRDKGINQGLNLIRQLLYPKKLISLRNSSCSGKLGKLYIIEIVRGSNNEATDIGRFT